ncbi:MAG: hypothetical protein OYH77_08430 [Pseudomonadota bacterium]|nr:hypothetical protein [Pseudomonadota bacterium]
MIPTVICNYCVAVVTEAKELHSLPTKQPSNQATKQPSNQATKQGLSKSYPCATFKL